MQKNQCGSWKGGCRGLSRGNGYEDSDYMKGFLHLSNLRYFQLSFHDFNYTCKRTLFSLIAFKYLL